MYFIFGFVALLSVAGDFAFSCAAVFSVHIESRDIFGAFAYRC
jgi:hypothetical protein